MLSIKKKSVLKHWEGVYDGEQKWKNIESLLFKHNGLLDSQI